MMSPQNGVLLDLATIDQGDLDLSPLGRVCGAWRRYPHTEPTQLLEHLGDAQIVVTNKVALDRVILIRLRDRDPSQGQITDLTGLVLDVDGAPINAALV